MRHPSYLAGELVLAALILVLTGVDSPFFFFTLGTALLGGLVYGYPGAALFSVMLIVGYAYAIHIRAPIDGTDVDFRTIVVLPSLYPIVAVAGAGARRLLDRQAEAEETLADQERAMAVQAERERLARDMHDSLAKTVHGIGFAALALSRRIQVDPPGAVEDARKLADDARTAAQEARELLSGLRGRDDAELPLPTAIRSEAARWGERTGTRVGGSLDDVGPLPSLALRELRWILKEALANVERYAHAVARRRAPAAPGRAGRADDRRRRRRLRGPRRPRRARGRVVRPARDARAREAGGRRPERRVRARRRDRDLGLGPRRRAAASARRARATAARRGVLRYGAADGRRCGGIHVAMIRVLLVDDNAIVRRGIASLLADAEGIEVVGEAGDGKQAIEHRARGQRRTSCAWTCGCRSWTASPPPGRCRRRRRS